MGEEQELNGKRADAIPFCDPTLAIAFTNTHEYVLDMNPSRAILEFGKPAAQAARDKRKARALEKEEKKAACRAAKSLEPLPKATEEVPTKPITFSRVFFYVHRSIAPQSWRVDYHDGLNKNLSARLFTRTTAGELAIHSVHNLNTETQKVEVESLGKLMGNPKLSHIVVGDFNLHHKSWAGELLKPKQASQKAKELKNVMDVAGMKLVTQKGTKTYTRSGANAPEHSSGDTAAPSEPTPSPDDPMISTDDSSATANDGMALATNLAPSVNNSTVTADGPMVSAENSTNLANNAATSTNDATVVAGDPTASAGGNTGSTWVENTASCIDLTWVSQDLEHKVQSWGVHKKTLVPESDHRCIRTILDLSVNLDKARYYNYEKGAHGAYKAFLSTKMQEFDNRKLDDEEDIDEAIEDFCKILIEVRDKFIPNHLAHPP